MSRPSKEQVDHALRLNDAGVMYMPTQDVPELLVVDILATEVRALLEELAGYSECAEDNRRLRAEFTELREAAESVKDVEPYERRYRPAFDRLAAVLAKVMP